MGLFSGKKIITVSSTLYNMAGDEDDRPDYLKGVLFASMIQNSESLGDDITKSYLEGPGIKQRQFFKYAQRSNLAGLPTVTATNSNPVDPAVVAGEIDVPNDPAGLVVEVQNSMIVDGDPEPFIQRWILENYPERVNEDWLGEFDESTEEFSVQFPNGDFFSFTDTEFDPSNQYIYATYVNILPAEEQPVVEESNQTVTSQVDLTGYDEISSTGTFTNVVLQRTADITVEYDDGTPTEHSTEDADVTEPLNTSEDVYERTLITETDGYTTTGQLNRYSYTGSDIVVGGYYHEEVVVEDLPAGYTKTTTTITTGEQIQEQWTEVHETQEIQESAVVGGGKLFIYRIGDGNATLDALAVEADTSNFQEFYPFLPVRLNNKSLSHEIYENNGLYDETKKAYRRATDWKNIDDILEEVEDNDSIDDIDYAYIMYGCSLNVKENACRKYIYNFMENMIQFQNTNSSSISDFQDQIDAYEQAQQDLEDWQNLDQSGVPWEDRVPRPSIPNITVPSVTRLKLKTDSTLMPSYDIRLEWVHIEQEQFSGTFTITPVIGDPRQSTIGEVYFEKGPNISWTEREAFGNSDNDTFRTINREIESIYMYYQVTDSTYRRLQVFGFTHYNYIYGGKSVKITAHEALDDSDISGFVIPLHYPTMKAMSIVDYTQMATANVHILFNSYEVTKQKWWQTGFFKILLIILVIVVAVIINPGAFAAGGGILGGNLAIGAALGLTGTAAIIAGVVANYLASIVISQLLSVVGTALFGEKWGTVFAAIATFAFSAAMSGMNLFSAEGLLGLGNALANGYSGWVQGDIAEMQEDYEADLDQYEEQMEYIDDLIAGLGGNDLNFNPIFLTDSVQGNGSGSGKGYMPETADEFIRRTTMVGSDIVEITQSMVYDFVEVQQTLPRN